MTADVQRQDEIGVMAKACNQRDPACQRINLGQYGLTFRQDGVWALRGGQ